MEPEPNSDGLRNLRKLVSEFRERKELPDIAGQASGRLRRFTDEAIIVDLMPTKNVSEHDKTANERLRRLSADLGTSISRSQDNLDNLEILDIANSLGDDVVRDWCIQNPDKAALMQFSVPDTANFEAGKTAESFFGRISLLPVKEQRATADDVINAYRERASTAPSI